ncbi:glycoside hydrolase family 3 N-terminal domain-containing protein [Alicyclobacillus fastidiosus]|uniref:glycoside hydrolase family 3 N-terminal domain-containing protein n=1 Tax=Alicyclobacillus fastidiosus TaxID=392011 RepID=UPI0023EA2886|nr:glycoside hydrolase family 3 N-terminal domain-containing protein [Alicyclobacillus fastidiosus]GMA66095.1 hypothetical protein GCM10025859_65370 [Alicyclobacillus fastidiosus]
MERIIWKRRSTVVLAGMLAVLLFGAYHAMSHNNQSKPWTDAHQPVDRRVNELVEHMTFDDKLALLQGVGQESGVSGYVGHINANPRLKIPSINLEDGAQGIGDNVPGVTALPAPISLSASWDHSDAVLYGTLLGREASGKGVNVLLGPNVNIMRTALNGRTFESYGEDPYLNAEMGTSVIDGIQSQHVIAVVKHFVANNQETDRTSENDHIDQRTLHEIYLLPFEAAVKDGNVGAVMAAYNQVNGQYMTDNRSLLTGVLDDSWGFKGFVVSDWGATHNTFQAIQAGLDMNMPGGKNQPDYFGVPLRKAVVSGQISISTINNDVRRILRPLFDVGAFNQAPEGNLQKKVTNSSDDREAQKIEEDGTVLLKDTGGILPLENVHTIAVIGQSASENPMISGGGSAHVNASSVVTPFEGIKQRAGSSIRVLYSPGTLPIPTGPTFINSPNWFPVIPGQLFGKGIQTQYFQSTDLSGTPVETRSSDIDFSWTKKPVPQITSSGWSAKWIGRVTPPTSGTYTFGLSSSGGSRLYINGKIVLDRWNKGMTQSTCTAIATAGHPCLSNSITLRMALRHHPTRCCH